MSKFLNILKLLRHYDYLGSERLETGTELIGRAPHIAAQAWLHSIYPGLSNSEIKYLEKNTCIRFHEDFKEFLSVTNGLKVFVTTLSIYGLRLNYKRDIISSRQPFDILASNIDSRPEFAQKDWLFIGSYDWDGSKLIMKPTGEISCCSRNGKEIYNNWSNLENMLESEILRLVSLFNNEGVEYNANTPTYPPR